VGGLLAGVLVFPTLRIAIRDPDRRRRVARSVIGWLFRLFIGLMAGLGGLSWRMSGMRAVAPGQANVIVANHPTLIDVVFLIAHFPYADCVVKGSLWRNPFMSPTLRAADYVSNDSPVQMLEECIRRLKSGHSLILFPEATRGQPDEPLQFRPGAAAVAVRSGRPFLPVLIRCAPPVLGRGQPWWHVPARRPQFQLEVRAPIAVESLAGRSTSLREATSAANAALQRWFEQELGGASRSASGHLRGCR
jgi:1-acyl-sn-glycerol-3-phosphate acyltransferase